VCVIIYIPKHGPFVRGGVLWTICDGSLVGIEEICWRMDVDRQLDTLFLYYGLLVRFPSLTRTYEHRLSYVLGIIPTHIHLLSRFVITCRYRCRPKVNIVVFVFYEHRQSYRCQFLHDRLTYRC